MASGVLSAVLPRYVLWHDCWRTCFSEYEIQNTGWKFCLESFLWPWFFKLLLEGPKFYVLSSVMTLCRYICVREEQNWFSFSHAACFGEWNIWSWHFCAFLSCYYFIWYFLRYLKPNHVPKSKDLLCKWENNWQKQKPVLWSSHPIFIPKFKGLQLSRLKNMENMWYIKIVLSRTFFRRAHLVF